MLIILKIYQFLEEIVIFDMATKDLGNDIIYSINSEEINDKVISFNVNELIARTNSGNDRKENSRDIISSFLHLKL